MFEQMRFAVFCPQAGRSKVISKPSTPPGPTHSRNSLWGRLFGRRWYILVANTSQIHDDATLRRLIDEAGFDLVARRRDRPYASVERLLFVLLSHLSHGVRDAFFKRIHVLNKLVIPVRAPDAFEYVCVKR